MSRVRATVPACVCVRACVWVCVGVSVVCMGRAGAMSPPLPSPCQRRWQLCLNQFYNVPHQPTTRQDPSAPSCSHATQSEVWRRGRGKQLEKHKNWYTAAVESPPPAPPYPVPGSRHQASGNRQLQTNCAIIFA